MTKYAPMLFGIGAFFASCVITQIFLAATGQPHVTWKEFLELLGAKR